MTIADWLGNIFWCLSKLANAVLLGDPRMSLSARIGWNIREGGAWSYLWLPGWLREHFERAADGSL